MVWVQLYALLLPITLMSIHHYTIFQYFIKHLDIADSNPGVECYPVFLLTECRRKGLPS